MSIWLLYQNSDSIIWMGLDSYFLKSDGHRKLLEAVFIQGLEASAYELSELSGLSYSTTHYELGRLAHENAIKSRKDGAAILYKSCLDQKSVEAFRTLFGFSSHLAYEKLPLDDRQIKSALAAQGAPVIVEDQAQPTTAIELEELFVRSVLLAKKDSSIARGLPVALFKVRKKLDHAGLIFWAKKLNAKQEMGFFLALTSELSGYRRYLRMAAQLKDKRIKEPRDFFFSQSSPLQRQLAEKNTPALARRWKLRMNMSMESFQSTFEKFKEAP